MYLSDVENLKKDLIKVEKKFLGRAIKGIKKYNAEKIRMLEIFINNIENFDDDSEPKELNELGHVRLYNTLMRLHQQGNEDEEVLEKFLAIHYGENFKEVSMVISEINDNYKSQVEPNILMNDRLMYHLIRNPQEVQHFKEAVSLYYYILLDREISDRLEYPQIRFLAECVFGKFKYLKAIASVIEKADSGKLLGKLPGKVELLSLFFYGDDSIEFDELFNKIYTEFKSDQKEMAEVISLVFSFLNPKNLAKIAVDSQALFDFIRIKRDDIAYKAKFLQQISNIQNPFIYCVLALVHTYDPDYQDFAEAFKLSQGIPEDTIWYKNLGINFFNLLEFRNLSVTEEKSAEQYQRMFELMASMMAQKEVKEFYELFTLSSIDRVKVLQYHQPKNGNYCLEIIQIEKLLNQQSKTAGQYAELFTFIAKAIRDPKVSVIYKDLLKSDVKADRDQAILYRDLNSNMQAYYDRSYSLAPSVSGARFNFYASIHSNNQPDYQKQDLDHEEDKLSIALSKSHR